MIALEQFQDTSDLCYNFLVILLGTLDKGLWFFDGVIQSLRWCNCGDFRGDPSSTAGWFLFCILLVFVAPLQKKINSKKLIFCAIARWQRFKFVRGTAVRMGTLLSELLSRKAVNIVVPTRSSLLFFNSLQGKNKGLVIISHTAGFIQEYLPHFFLLISWEWDKMYFVPAEGLQTLFCFSAVLGN